MSELREDLYTILIFDMGVEKIIWNVLTALEAPHQQRILMIKETIQFLQYFNNNYRPIYHLEKYIDALIKTTRIGRKFLTGNDKTTITI